MKVNNSKLVEYVRLVELEHEGKTYNVEFLLDSHSYDWRVWDGTKELNRDEIMETFELNDDLFTMVFEDLDNEGAEFEVTK